MLLHRLKITLISAASVALIVFCAYSIPAYYHLLAHQPGRDPSPTSFPPSYAFFLGGYFAILSFVGVSILFAIAYALVSLLRQRKRV